MPKMRSSQRRFRTYVVLAFVVFAIYYLTPSHSDPQDFYRKTMQAMNGINTHPTTDRPAAAGPQHPPIPDALEHKEITDQGDAKVVKGMSDRLRDAEAQAKDLANKKSPLKPDLPSEVVGIGSSAGGQNGKDREKEKAKEKEGGAAIKVDKQAVGGVAADQKELGVGAVTTSAKETNKAQEKQEENEDETPQEHEAEVELTSILKRAPMIIFSKSYCPYSKRAKHLLLETYTIDPEPYVVELDTHPLGPAIQELLAKKTGRNTVPNIMVNGISIGGSDDIVALDDKGELVSKVLEFGEARKLTMQVTAEIKGKKEKDTIRGRRGGKRAMPFEKRE